MTTPEMVRCRKCPYLIEEENGAWICQEIGLDIHEICDEECALEQDW